VPYDPHIDPALQFDVGRAQVEKLIDDVLASGEEAVMRAALAQLKRQAAPYLDWTDKPSAPALRLDHQSV
jgi:adenine-specific DNA-methyltransferase